MVVWVLTVFGVLRWVVPRLLGDERGRDAVRRFNRRWLNPVMLRMAGRPNWYAARLEHVGRRSGRLYATPVVAKPVTGGYAVPLPYGRNVDWLRNLEAGGRARLQVGGQRYRVANPRIVPLAEIETQLPVFYRRTSGRRMIPEWLVLTAGPDAAAPSTTSASSVLGVTGGQASGCTESPRRRSDAVAPSKRIG
jgi:deazaflavin-dependent oxidoreductase (nitroreductase family)